MGAPSPGTPAWPARSSARMEGPAWSRMGDRFASAPTPSSPASVANFVSVFLKAVCTSLARRD